MPDRPLSQNDPYSIILAADYRQSPQDLTNDTVWEVKVDGRESEGLSLYSTISLSVSSLRIIPVFTNQTQSKINLKQLNDPPILESQTPSYVRFQLIPFPNITCKLEFWVQNSHLLLGRFSVKNGSKETFEGNIAWRVQLIPLSGEGGMKLINNGSQSYLHGHADKDHVIFILTGAPNSGKQGQISLQNDLKLREDEQQFFQWAFVVDQSKQSALVAANSAININWEAETARLEVANQKDLFYISSGNHEWDVALESSQRLAQQLITRSQENPGEYFLLKSRTPDQKIRSGFQRKQMSDPVSLNLLEQWYLMQVLPSAASLLRDVTARTISEFADLTGARNQYHFDNILKPKLPYPILATLMAETYEWDLDKEWVSHHFEGLINFLKLWLEIYPKENENGIPAFGSALQSNFEQFPIHNRWSKDGIGIDARYIASPFLLSLLFKEVSQAIRLGKIIKSSPVEISWLEQQRGALKKSLSDLWDQRKSHFIYKDIKTLKGYAGKFLFSGSGSGLFDIKKKLNNESRLNIRLLSQQEHTRNTRIWIYGKSGDTKLTEEIIPSTIHWYGQHGFYTTRHIFTVIDQMKVVHLSELDSITLTTSDFRQDDLSLAMPLWAGAVDPKRSTLLVERWLIPEFLQPFGMPLVPMSKQPAGNDAFNNIHLILNCFILQGLLQYDYQHHVLKLYSNTMFAVTKNLKLFHRLMKQYDASDGYGTGDYNIISGAVPISVFLNLAGIKKWTASEVLINNISAFESPVIIRFRGNTITTTENGHRFSSHGGATIETSGKGPHLIRIPH